MIYEQKNISAEKEAKGKRTRIHEKDEYGGGQEGTKKKAFKRQESFKRVALYL